MYNSTRPILTIGVSLEPVAKQFSYADTRSKLGGKRRQTWASDDIFAALTDISGAWIDRMHDRRRLNMIILDMEDSDNQSQGESPGARVHDG